VCGSTKTVRCPDSPVNRLYLLVWYERHEHMESAILREKQLKAGSRQRKLDLIESLNPQWQDLYEQILL